jgi:hypothetical protein
VAGNNAACAVRFARHAAETLNQRLDLAVQVA